MRQTRNGVPRRVVGEAIPPRFFQTVLYSWSLEGHPGARDTLARPPTARFYCCLN
jgi:hypothetical protein